MNEVFFNNFVYIITRQVGKNNLGGNTLIEGLINKEQIKKTELVEIKRLDEYIFENEIKNISLIKIDVEGYEFAVLKGLSRFLEKKLQKYPLIIVEIIPSAYSLQGLNLKALDNYMKNYFYYAYTLDGKSRIDITKYENIHVFNVLFMHEN